jgi:hypothetical protein
MPTATMYSSSSSSASNADFSSSRQEDRTNVPKTIQYKQLCLVSRESNLVDRIVYESHLRVQDWVHALEIQQIALSQRRHIFDVVNP